jgi:hypothetical protein
MISLWSGSSLTPNSARLKAGVGWAVAGGRRPGVGVGEVWARIETPAQHTKIRINEELLSMIGEPLDQNANGDVSGCRMYLQNDVSNLKFKISDV